MGFWPCFDIKQSELMKEIEMSTISDIINVYIGYFDRAPDPEGLNYWVNRIDNEGYTLAEAAASFSVQPESTALYPYLAAPAVASPTAFITAVYANLFNRTPDAEGLAYWEGELAAAAGNAAAIGSMILNIISGAVTDPDATVLANKNAAATDWVESVAEISAFEFDNDAAIAARDVLDGVDDTDDSVAAAADKTDAFVASADSGEGDTFILQPGVDQIDGTPQDDTILAGESTANNETINNLGSSDSIDGFEGFDILSITDSDSNTLFPNMMNVERIDVQPLNFANPNVDLLNVDDQLQQVWNVNNPGGSVDLLNVHQDIVSGFYNAGSIADGNQAFTYVDHTSDAIQDGAVDIATMNSNAYLDVDINDDTAPVDTLNIDSSGGPSQLYVNLFGNNNEIMNLNVSGDGLLDFDGDSTSTANLLMVNITNTAGVDANLVDNNEDLTFAGGAGDDRLLLDSNEFDDQDILDGGDGNDILGLTNGPFNTLDDEDDSLVMAIAGTTNFETLEIQPGGDVILDASLFGINDFLISDEDSGDVGNVSVSNVEDGDTFTIFDEGGNSEDVLFSAEDDATTLDVLFKSDGTVENDSLQILGFETANISLDSGSGSGAEFSDILADDGTSILFTGDITDESNGQFDAKLTGGEVTVDLSGLTTGTSGSNQVDGSEDDETIIGTAQDDDLFGNGGDDILSGGDGDDILDGGMGNIAAADGETTIDFTALNDIDGNTDGDDDVVAGYSVTVDGNVYSVDIGDANIAASVIAAQIDGAGGNVASASAAAGVITVISTSTTAVAASGLEADVIPDAEAVTITGTHTPTVAETDSTSTITIAETSIAVNTVVTVDVDDADGGTNETVSYTVLNTDIGATDAETAANVATGLANAIAAENAGAVLADASINVVGNVITLTDLNGGSTNPITVVEVADISSIMTVSNSTGVDSQPVETFTITSGFTPDADGELEVTIDGVTATIAVTDGVFVSAAAIGEAVEDADGVGGTIDGEDDNAELNFSTDNTTAPVITATFTPDRIDDVAQDDSQITTTDGVAVMTSGLDTYTGGAGEDTFVVKSLISGFVDSDTEIDVITDFTNADDLIDFDNFAVDGDADNYSEGPVNGFGDFLGALTQANSDFLANNDLQYVAQEVGDDTFIFASTGGGSAASDVVQLQGVSLADLDDDGAFLIA